MSFSLPFSPLCQFFLEALIMMSSSALTLLLCFSSPNFFHFLLNFCSPTILFLWAVSLPYIEVSFSVILYYTPFFSHSICVGGAHSFSAEVLIKHDSQFNYFYSGARPLESCSFSPSYIFYLFSTFPPIFLPWCFILPNLTSLIISPFRIFALSLLLTLPRSFSHHCPFLLSPRVL